jgi:hypothetical protein
MKHLCHFKNVHNLKNLEYYFLSNVCCGNPNICSLLRNCTHFKNTDAANLTPFIPYTEILKYSKHIVIVVSIIERDAPVDALVDAPVFIRGFQVMMLRICKSEQN